jgi:uncharacterized membrane protein YeaQ/YmgE (transglycosylase-associated protein family)
MTFDQVGALCFGLVIGWVTYRTLRRREGTSALSDIATVIGAVGGAAVLTTFKAPGLFAAYSIGLAIGFFLYFVISLKVTGTANAKTWMGD